MNSPATPPPSPHQISSNQLIRRLSFPRKKAATVSMNSDGADVDKTDCYSCALKTGLWLDHGALTLNITQKMISFKSPFTKQVTIPVTSIRAIKRASLLAVPTAIIIETDSREVRFKYFFASFLSREKCFTTLEKLTSAVQYSPNEYDSLQEEFLESSFLIQRASTLPSIKSGSTSGIAQNGQEKDQVKRSKTTESKMRVEKHKNLVADNPSQKRLQQLHVEPTQANTHKWLGFWAEGNANHNIILSVVVVFVLANLIVLGLAGYVMLRLSAVLKEIGMEGVEVAFD